MALTKEDLQAIAGLLQPLKEDIQGMKEDIQNMKEETGGIKEEIRQINSRLTSLELKIENETNHNIQLLAENNINIVNKLNDAIRVQDKSIIYEVQVSGLKARVECLEKEVEALKKQTA